MKKNEPIEKRVFKNTILGVVSFFLTFLQALISVPVLLHFWGKETYGLWLSLFAGFTLLQTLDLGHQNYVGNKLNILYHIDKNEFKKTLGSSLVIAYLIGSVQFLIGLYIIFSGLIGSFLGADISTSTFGQLEIAFIALILMWLIFGSASGIIVKILIPAGMMYESQWLGILMRLSQSVSLILVAILGGRILMAGIMVAIVQSVVTVFVLFFLKRKLPEFYPWWQVREWRTAFNNFRYSLVITANSVTQQLGNNGVILFIAKFFQASMVPVFTTLRTITNTATNATNIFIYALIPDVVKFHARGEKEKLLISFDANWFVSSMVVNIGIVLLIPFVREIYLLWTNGQLGFNFPLFLCLAAGISFFNFGSGLFTYLTSINDLTAQTFITISRVVIIFAVSYLLIENSGILGIGIGVVSSEIIASVLLPIFFVNLRLKRMKTALNSRNMLMALVPPIVILIDTLILSSYSYYSLVISLLSLIILIPHYYLNWRFLDIEIKRRIKLIIGKVFPFNILWGVKNK